MSVALWCIVLPHSSLKRVNFCVFIQTGLLLLNETYILKVEKNTTAAADGRVLVAGRCQLPSPRRFSFCRIPKNFNLRVSVLDIY